MRAIASIPSIMRNNVQLLFGKPASGTEATARFLSMVSSRGPPKAQSAAGRYSAWDAVQWEFLPSIFKSWVGFPVKSQGQSCRDRCRLSL